MGKINSKVEEIESRTASWNGFSSTFEGPLYMRFDCLYNFCLKDFIVKRTERDVIINVYCILVFM